MKLNYTNPGFLQNRYNASRGVLTMFRAAVPALVFSVTLFAGGKKEPPTARGETETVEVTATPILERDAIKQILGSDLDGHYLLMNVRVSSRFGKEITVNRDDFLLRTDKDGEKSAPFAPSQIAGSGVLVITETGAQGGGMMGDGNGPVWGGAPGTDGRPRRLGGDGGVAGSGPGATEARAAMRNEKSNPLLETLKQKILPESKTTKSLSGLLYFPMEKQKLKDLELTYTAWDGKIKLRFR